MLRLPGDKSISHRAALLAALARGHSHLRNFSSSADCQATLRCLKQLGVQIEKNETDIQIKGAGLEGLSASQEPLDCGNSGTTMRLLAGVLAGQAFATELIGDESLQSRPMNRVIEPLELMGARISSNQGRAPLRIIGRQPLHALSYEMPVASAQVKSCILLAGLYAGGRTEVIEEFGITRDHTERLLKWFGVPLKTRTERRARKLLQVHALESPARRLRARETNIPGDISSAAYFFAAAALLPGSSLEIRDVGFNPTRFKIVPTLKTLGAQLRVDELREECNELLATVYVNGSDCLRPTATDRPLTFDGSIIPQLIDELPLLAVVGTQVEGGIIIREAAELRVKESDRISATVVNLRAMGADVEEYEDGLRVAGRTQLRGAKLDSCGDHRIVMAFTIAALLADGESEIAGAEAVAVSFPEFFQLLESIVER
jgi:3-phosphoshikimate 1-carboxyvinyltransferase